MIRHIVFFSMKPEALERDGLANAHAMAEHFRRISKEIPGVCSVELGLNYNSEERFYEMALNQVFESRQALTDCAARSGSPYPGAYRGQLSGVSRSGAAVSLPCRLRRTYDDRRRAGLHKISHHGHNARRRGRGVL